MVLYEPQEIGGLEEYTATLAIGLHQRGHQVSLLSTTWTPPENQYLHRLREHGVKIVQIPKWLSRPASHWPTKQRILAAIMWLSYPLICLLAGGLVLFRQSSWQQALTSAYGWLRGQVQCRLTGPDQRQPLARLLLQWWHWRSRPDLLHIQGYTSTLLFVIEWAHAHQIPVVYEEHQTPDAQFDWWHGFQHTINKATTVVAVSEKSAQGLRTICGVTRPIVVRAPLLPDPIESSCGTQVPTRNPNQPLHITTVARLYVTKGLTYLLDAIVQVQTVYPNTQFSVYGDGDQRQMLLAYAEKLGLDGQAIFVGSFTSRAELAQIMAETDIFVLSSLLEGQPLAVVEAMAYGCPIVTTAVGGIPELIEDGVNGLLCQPQDAAGLADKICTLIADPVLRRQLGYAARRAYEQSPFQPATLCEHFISIYHGALQQAPAKAGDWQKLAPTLNG